MSQIDVPLVRSDSDRHREPIIGGCSRWLFFSAFRLYRVFHVGGVFKASITGLARIFRRCIRRNCLAILGHAWFGAKPSWMPAWVTAAMLILWAPGRLSGDLLLLSRSVLQSFLGGPSLLRRGRASQDISGRALVSADYAKHSSIFSVSRAGVSGDSRPRCVGWVLV